MSEPEAIAGQLAELMKMMTIMASEQTKISSEQTKISKEQSKMASEQIKISDEQSKMAKAHYQLTERLETVAYRQNTLRACVENSQISTFPKSDVKSRTPEVARGLDVPLSVDTTRGPSMGMGGGLPLDPTPWVRERDMQSSSSYQSEMIKKGGEPDYRWSLLYIFVYCKSDDTPHQRTNEQSDN